MIFDCPSGDGIPIEERSAQEVVEAFGKRIAPEGVTVRHPAFDVTPARLITAKRTHITASTTNPPVDINIWGDEAGRLLRLTVPSQGLDVARTDIASVSARQVTISRPNDEAVRILRKKGLRASRLDEGVLEWRDRGLPIEVSSAEVTP